MKRTISVALSIIFAATIFYFSMHFFVAPHNAKKSAFVGKTESFTQIEEILSNAEFSMNQLKQHIRAKEYIESPRKQKLAYVNSLIYAIFMVSFYNVGRYALKRICNDQSFENDK